MKEKFYPLLVVLGFNVIDIVSGLIAGVKKGGVKSSKLREGLFKKCGFLLCCSLGLLIDAYGKYVGIEIGIKILPPILMYVCSTEIVSVIENVGAINPALLPQKIINLFLQIKPDKKE